MGQGPNSFEEKKENSGKWRKAFLFFELNQYKITMNNFTQFKQLIYYIMLGTLKCQVLRTVLTCQRGSFLIQLHL